MGINKTGSILIWSIFLVLFVTFSFLYISNGIGKQIDKNKMKIQQLQNDTFLENTSLGENNKQGSSYNENYEFQFYDSFYSTLRENEEINIVFTQANTGSIELKTGGAIYYEVSDNGGVDSKGILTGALMNLPLGGTLGNNKILTLRNLGGLSSISMEFASGTGIIFPYNYYQKIKNIGGIDIIKETGMVK